MEKRLVKINFYCLPIASSTLPPEKKREESRERRKETVQSHLKTKYDLMIVRKRKKASVSFTRSDAQM
jgi:hypothetical protein